MNVREKLVASQEKLHAIVTIMKPSETKDGVLSGVPVAIKDNFSTKGVLTSACCKILDNYVPVFDATVVEKLKQAGADLVCKTTMDELAMGGTGLNYYKGPTHNPYDVSRISGGSSSGSAALVGAHLVDFAIGSDTGDSVRKPAGFCGCVGFKPSYGLISRYGVIPYASSLDHVAYFTKTVQQAGLMLKVLAGRDDKDLTSLDVKHPDYTALQGELKGKVIGIIDEIMDAKEDDVYKQQIDVLLQQLVAQGAVIKHFSFDKKMLDMVLVVYHLIANCESTANHANLDGIRFGHRVAGDSLMETMVNSRTAGFGSLLKKRFIIGAFGLDDMHQKDLFQKAQKVRRLIVDAYRQILDECDVVLTPVSNGIAPKMSEVGVVNEKDNLVVIENHLVLANFAGNPSITLPLGFMDGCPVGINLSGKCLDELNVLSIAQQIESLIQFEEKEKGVNPWLTK